MKDLLEEGADDSEVLATGRETDRVVVTYDRKDYTDTTGHAGVCIATETMQARSVRRAIERIERAYPALDDVVEHLSDWAD